MLNGLILLSNCGALLFHKYISCTLLGVQLVGRECQCQVLRTINGIQHSYQSCPMHTAEVDSYAIYDRTKPESRCDYLCTSQNPRSCESRMKVCNWIIQMKVQLCKTTRCKYGCAVERICILKGGMHMIFLRCSRSLADEYKVQWSKYTQHISVFRSCTPFFI